MIPKIRSSSLELAKSGEIYVEARVVAALQQIPPSDLDKLFQYLRLDLHQKMESLDNDHEIHKLQGKLEYNRELAKFFNDLLSRIS